MSAPLLSTDVNPRTRVVFARLALAASLLTLIVIMASAFIRHTHAGLSCVDWPSCYATIDGSGATSTSVSIARLLHRLAATAALIIAVGIWLSARSRGREFNRLRRLSLAAVLVAAALGALGVATSGPAVPAVPLGNMIGGFIMLALLAASAGAATDDRGFFPHRPAPPWHRGLALALGVLVLAQACIGGLIGTRFALTACSELFQCAGSAASPAAGATLGPFQLLSMSGGRFVPPAHAATLHVIHRLLGIAVTVLAVGLAAVSRSTTPHTSLVLGVLALVVPLLGAAAVFAMPALALTVLHNAATALLLATLAFAAARSWVGSSTASPRSLQGVLPSRRPADPAIHDSIADQDGSVPRQRSAVQGARP